MKQIYQSPEAVEIAKADSIILGQKPGDYWDEPTLSFVRTLESAVDVDEQNARPVAQVKFQLET